MPGGLPLPGEKGRVRAQTGGGGHLTVPVQNGQAVPAGLGYFFVNEPFFQGFLWPAP